MTIPGAVNGGEPAACAMPKSVIFTRPSEVSSMLPGLDVAVHQPGPVRGVQRGRGLRDHVAGEVGGQRLALDDLGERRPVDVLHDEVRPPMAGDGARRMDAGSRTPARYAGG